jgi:hypothetical protein
VAADGLLNIKGHADLTRVDFPSLRSVAGYLLIHTNTKLTYASLPQLTFIGKQLYFCGNHPSFLIPTGPPNAPQGGLAVTGQFKGMDVCWIRNGNGACSLPYDVCP